MKHELPPLPYDYDALEPYYEERTLRLHHDAHHQAYVDGLNNALQYQNKRAAFIEAWWNLVNWDDVNRRFAAVRGGH